MNAIAECFRREHMPCLPFPVEIPSVSTFEGVTVTCSLRKVDRRGSLPADLVALLGECTPADRFYGQYYLVKVFFENGQPQKHFYFVPAQSRFVQQRQGIIGEVYDASAISLARVEVTPWKNSVDPWIVFQYVRPTGGKNSVSWCLNRD